MSKFATLISIICDKKISEDVKLKTIQEINDRLETIISAGDYPIFLESIIPNFLKLLQDEEINFVAECVEQQKRKAIYEVIYRLPSNDYLKSYVKQLLSNLLLLLTKENEGNALIIIKTILELLKQYRPTQFNEINYFLNFFTTKIKEINEKSHLILNENTRNNLKILALKKETLNSLLDNLYYSINVLVENIGTDSPQLSLPSSQSQQSQPHFTLLPRSILSLKVLSELPIIVVIIYQLYKPNIHQEINLIIPYLIQYVCLELNLSHEKLAVSFNKEVFCEFVTSQVKILSFIAYIVRPFQDTLNQYSGDLIKGIVLLLKQCPPELANMRKEILIALRHIQATHLRNKFIPYLNEILDHKLLLGPSLTCFDTLCPLAYSSLADIVHHLRTSLTLTQLELALSVFSKNIEDDTLPFSIQNVSCKLLLNLVECVKIRAETENAQNGRAVIVKILKVFVLKFKVLSQFKVKSIYRDIDKLICENINYGKMLGTQQDDKGIEGAAADHNYFVSLPTTFTLAHNSLNDIKVLMRTLITGVKTVTWGILTCKAGINNYVHQSKLLVPEEANLYVSFIEYCLDTLILLYAPFNSNSNSFNTNNYKTNLPFLPNLITFYKVMLMNNSTAVSSLTPSTGVGTVATIPVYETVRNNNNNNNNNSFSTYSGTQIKEEKENLDTFVGIFLMINPMSFYQIFSAPNMTPNLVDMVLKDQNIIVLFNCFLASSTTSPPFTNIIMDYLLSRFDDLGLHREKANLFLKIYKLIFGSVSYISTENESILKNHLSFIITKCMGSAVTAKEPFNYFLLLRYLFRFIGNGTHDSLYQEFLPLLPNLLQSLNSYLCASDSNDYGRHFCPAVAAFVRQPNPNPSSPLGAVSTPSTASCLTSVINRGGIQYQLRDLYVELCLTVPVRLSSLLPHLPLLMDPLICALNSLAPYQVNSIKVNSDSLSSGGSVVGTSIITPNYISDLAWSMCGNQGMALVSQGLRTLELCVDNLQPEFLKEHLDPVKSRIIKALWRLLGHTFPSNSVTSAVTFNLHHSTTTDVNTANPNTVNASNQNINNSQQYQQYLHSVNNLGGGGNSLNTSLSSSFDSGSGVGTGNITVAGGGISATQPSGHNTSETAITHAAFRLLGKFGGSNRKNLKECQELINYDCLRGRGSYFGLTLQNTPEGNIINVPFGPIIDMAYQSINFGSTDLVDRANAWKVISYYLILNISTEFDEENKIFGLFSPGTSLKPLEDFEGTKIIDDQGNPHRGIRIRYCRDEKARDTHRKALAALFMSTAITDLHSESSKLACALLNHYTLVMLSRQTGIFAAIAYPSSHDSYQTLNNGNEALTRAMDPEVLIDAIVLDLMGHPDKELCKPAVKALVKIIDTSTLVLGGNIETTFTLPLCDHVLERILALCYASSWFEKYGGCIGVNLLLVKGSTSWLIRHLEDFLKALFYVLMDLTNDVSHGTLNLAKSVLHKLVKFYLSIDNELSLINTRNSRRDECVNSLMKELLTRITSSVKVVRTEAMQGLCLISQKTCVPLCESVKQFSSLVYDLVPPKKHLLRHQSVNSQFGLMDAMIFLSGEYELFTREDQDAIKPPGKFFGVKPLLPSSPKQMATNSATTSDNAYTTTISESAPECSISHHQSTPAINEGDTEMGSDYPNYVDSVQNRRIFTLDLNVIEHRVFFSELTSICETEDSLLLRLPCYKNLGNDLNDLKCSALRALTSCHYITQYREKIFTILFKSLNCSIPDIQCTAFECLSSFVKNHAVDMETVHHSIRNLLLMLGDYRNLTPHFMTRLLYYTCIFPNTFNEKFCEHLMTHLITLLKVLSAKSGIKTNCQELKICAEIVKIFVSLPNASSQVLNSLCTQMISALDSIFLNEVTIYLLPEFYKLFSLYPKETSSIFLTQPNICTKSYYTLYLKLLDYRASDDTTNVLIEYLIKNIGLLVEILMQQARKLASSFPPKVDRGDVVSVQETIDTNEATTSIPEPIIINYGSTGDQNTILTTLLVCLKVLRSLEKQHDYEDPQRGGGGHNVLTNFHDLASVLRLIWKCENFQSIYKGNDAFYTDSWDCPNLIIHHLITYFNANRDTQYVIIFELASCFHEKYIESIDELKEFIHQTLVQYPLPWKQKLFLYFIRYIYPSTTHWKEEVTKASILENILYPLFEDAFKHYERDTEKVMNVDKLLLETSVATIQNLENNQSAAAKDSSIKTSLPTADLVETNLFRLFVEVCIQTPQEIQQQRIARQSPNNQTAVTLNTNTPATPDDISQISTAPVPAIAKSVSSSSTTAGPMCNELKIALVRMTCLFIQYYKATTCDGSPGLNQQNSNVTPNQQAGQGDEPSSIIPSLAGSTNLVISTTPSPNQQSLIPNSKKQNALLRKLVTFAWPCLQNQVCIDPSVKYNGHLLLAYIVQKFSIHKRIVIQVFHSLLKASSSESRNIIKKALKIIVPAIPLKVDNGLTMLTYWTKKILLEEGHTLNQLAHILHIVLANKEIYYSARHSIIHLLLGAMTKLGFSGNNTSENKKLVVDIAEVIIEWESKALLSASMASCNDNNNTTPPPDISKNLVEVLGTADNIAAPIKNVVNKDIPSSTPSSAALNDTTLKPFGPIVGENIINFLLRISCPITEASTSGTSQSHVTEYLINKCHFLMMKACDLPPWRNIHLKLSWIDKILTSLENLTSQQPPSQHQSTPSPQQQSSTNVNNNIPSPITCTSSPNIPTTPAGGTPGMATSSGIPIPLNPHQLLQQKISVNALCSFLETLTTTKILLKLSKDDSPINNTNIDDVKLPPLNNRALYERISFRQIAKVLSWSLSNTLVPYATTTTTTSSSNVTASHSYPHQIVSQLSTIDFNLEQLSSSGPSTTTNLLSTNKNSSLSVRVARSFRNFMESNLVAPNLLAPTLYANSFITDQKQLINKHIPNWESKNFAYSPWVSPDILKLVQNQASEESSYNFDEIGSNNISNHNGLNKRMNPASTIYPEELEEFYKRLCSLFTEYLTSLERININQLGTLNHAFCILKICCDGNMYFIDRYLSSFMKIFQKVVKDHLATCSLTTPFGGSNNNSNVQNLATTSSSSIAGTNNAGGPDHDTLVAHRNCITISLDLIKSRLNIMSNEMRKNFIGNILIGLIEKSTDPKLLSFIIDLVWSWLKKPPTVLLNGNLYNNGGPSLREKSIILVKLTHCIEKRFCDNYHLKYKFLELILYVYKDPDFRSSELTSKLESAYLSGLKCPNPVLRRMFFQNFDSQIGRTIYDRLYYISSCQNWETFGSHFWIKQCIQLILMINQPNRPLINMSPTTVIPSICSIIRQAQSITDVRSNATKKGIEKVPPEEYALMERVKLFLSRLTTNTNIPSSSNYITTENNLDEYKPEELYYDYSSSSGSSESINEEQTDIEKLVDRLNNTTRSRLVGDGGVKIDEKRSGITLGPNRNDSMADSGTSTASLALRQLLLREINFIKKTRHSLLVVDNNHDDITRSTQIGTSSTIPDTAVPPTTTFWSSMNQEGFCEAVSEMCHLSTKLSEWLWITLMPQCWSIMNDIHKRNLYQEYQLFFLSGTHIVQKDCYPSVINVFFQAFTRCQPKVYLHPTIIKYLAKAHNLWYVSLKSLEEMYELAAFTTPQQHNINALSLIGVNVKEPATSFVGTGIQTTASSTVTGDPYKIKIDPSLPPPSLKSGDSVVDAFEFKCESVEENLMPPDIGKPSLLTLDQAIYDCLSDSYGYLGEFDVAYALWCNGCTNMKTIKALTQELWGDYHGALITYEDLMESTKTYLETFNKTNGSNISPYGKVMAERFGELNIVDKDDNRPRQSYLGTPEGYTECKVWETHWVDCLKELNQWDLIGRYASGGTSISSPLSPTGGQQHPTPSSHGASGSGGGGGSNVMKQLPNKLFNPQITLDTAWKFSDWNSMKEALTAVQKNCPRELAWKVNLCAGYLALSQSDEHHLSMMDRIVEITAGLGIREWKRLPCSVITRNIHGPLLRAANKVVELQEAAQLHISLQYQHHHLANTRTGTNNSNLIGSTVNLQQQSYDILQAELNQSAPSTGFGLNMGGFNVFNNPALGSVSGGSTPNFVEMRSIIKTWKNRFPLICDPYSYWHDIFTWRQQQYQYIANLFTVADQQHGHHYPNSHQMNRLMTGLPGSAAAATAGSNYFGGVDYNADSFNVIGAGTSSTSSNNPLLISTHSIAQGLIHLGTVARKQHKPIVGLEILNKVTMHPSIPIADCFRKVRQSIKCYLELYHMSVIEGLVTPQADPGLVKYPLRSVQGLLEETNLKYFTRDMLSEIYALKGYTLHLTGDYDESNKSFSTAIQLQDSHLKAWGMWGECLAQRFWERITANSQISRQQIQQSDNEQIKTEEENAALLAHPRLPYNFNLAKSAVTSLLQACRHTSESKVAKYLAQILWLLKYDDPTKYTLSEIVDKYLISIPTFHWLNWVPQLLMSLEKAEDSTQGRYVTNLITHIGRSYPQAIFFPVRTSFLSLKMEYKENTTTTGSSPGGITGPISATAVSAKTQISSLPISESFSKGSQFTTENILFSPTTLEQATTPLKTTSPMSLDEGEISAAKLPLKEGDIFRAASSTPNYSPLTSGEFSPFTQITDSQSFASSNSVVLPYPIATIDTSTNEMNIDLSESTNTQSTSLTTSPPITSNLPSAVSSTDDLSSIIKTLLPTTILSPSTYNNNSTTINLQNNVSLPNQFITDVQNTQQIGGSSMKVSTPVISTSAGVVPCSPIVWCRRILHVLRELHPTTLYTLEGLVDQLIWFRETWFEELLQYLKQILSKCYILAFQELKFNLKRYAVATFEEVPKVVEELFSEKELSTDGEDYDSNFIPYGQCSIDSETEPILAYISSIMIKLLTTFENGIENLANLASKLNNSSTESSVKRAQATIKDPMFKVLKIDFLRDFEFVRNKTLELSDIEGHLLGKVRKWVELLERKVEDELPKTYFMDDKCTLLNNWLQNDVEIELPGEIKYAKPSQYSVKICKFLPRIGVQSKCGFAACRKICVRGSDGKLYHYLVLNDNLFLSPTHSYALKPMEKRNSSHLRVVTSQIMRYINTVLEKQNETFKRDLSFRLSRMITISPHMTLVEIDDSMISLMDIYQKWKWMNRSCDPLVQFYDLIKSKNIDFGYEATPGGKNETLAERYRTLKSKLFSVVFKIIAGTKKLPLKADSGGDTTTHLNHFSQTASCVSDNILCHWVEQTYPTHHTSGLDAWCFRKNFASDFGLSSGFNVLFSVFPSLPEQILFVPRRLWCYGPSFATQIDLAQIMRNVVIRTIPSDDNNVHHEGGLVENRKGLEKHLIRLTPNLVKFFGRLMINGPLANSFKAFSRVLADPKIKLDHVLRALLNDIPSLNVSLSSATIFDNSLSPDEIIPPSTTVTDYYLNENSTNNQISVITSASDIKKQQLHSPSFDSTNNNSTINNQSSSTYVSDINLITFTETMNVVLTSITDMIRDFAPLNYDESFENKDTTTEEKDVINQLIQLSMNEQNMIEINPLFYPWL